MNNASVVEWQTRKTQNLLLETQRKGSSPFTGTMLCEYATLSSELIQRIAMNENRTTRHCSDKRLHEAVGREKVHIFLLVQLPTQVDRLQYRLTYAQVVERQTQRF